MVVPPTRHSGGTCATPTRFGQQPDGVGVPWQALRHQGIRNAVKYTWRAGLEGNAAENLRKAIWHIEREIKHFE